MKRIKNDKVMALGGRPLKLPKIGEDGEVIITAGVVATEDATIGRVFQLFVLQFPRNIMTQKDAIHGGRLYSQVSDAKEDILPIEDGEYEWIMKNLSENDIGAQMFGMHLVSIINTIKSSQVSAVEKRK